jgi:hypothetical protein
MTDGLWGDRSLTLAEKWEMDRNASWEAMRQAWLDWQAKVRRHEAAGYNGSNPFEVDR